MFVWIKNQTNPYILTFNQSSITLNASAASLFQHVRYCMIGMDEESHQLAIRPVTKEEIDKKIIDMNSIHKITIGKGYGRITSKVCMEQVSKLLNCDFDMMKVEATYDEKNQYLIADLKSIIDERK